MDPVPATPSPPPAAVDALYDARRGVYYVKPVLRGWLHLLWFAASLVVGTLLVASADGVVRITALAIYAASVSALFGISALYHRGTWTVAWNRRLQRLDHTMIFLLIAGTATPAFLLATSGTFRLACLIIMWVLTVTAAALRLAWMSAPELVAGSTFVGRVGQTLRQRHRVASPARGRGTGVAEDRAVTVLIPGESPATATTYAGVIRSLRGHQAGRPGTPSSLPGCARVSWRPVPGTVSAVVLRWCRRLAWMCGGACAERGRAQARCPGQLLPVRWSAGSGTSASRSAACRRRRWWPAWLSRA